MPAALLSGRGGPQLRVRGPQSGGQGAGSVEEESHTGPREAAAGLIVGEELAEATRGHGEVAPEP